jgi:hypothetical protein
MRKHTKRKRVKRAKTKKYRGGAIANQPIVQTETIDSGPIAFAKSAASSAKTNITKVGSSLVSSVSNKASGALNTVKGALWNRTQSAIQSLNNPVAEAKAEHAIDKAGFLATKIADAVKAPLEKSMNNTINAAVKASEKAGPAIVRSGIDIVEAVPVLGTAVLLADEVNQLVKIGDAGLKVAATAVEGAGDVADAVSDVLDTPIPDNINIDTTVDTTVDTNLNKNIDTTVDTNLNKNIDTTVVKEPEKQIGGMIRKRNGILRRIDHSVREFTGIKKNKTRRVKFRPHNTFY